MKIVVGYDGSDRSEPALALAVLHARAFNGRVYVLRCLETGADRSIEEVEKAERDLGEVRRYLSVRKVSCEIHLHLMLSGLNPGKDLVQFSKGIDADEIILAIRKKSKLGKLIFGSTAQHVILNAHCPVATVAACP
jgi:nucleotide-binding universal stress UspA family protein